MHHDIRTVLKRTAQDGCCKGIINNQWDTVAVGECRIPLDIQHVQSGIGDGFAEYESRVFIKQRIRFFVGHIGC